MKKVKGVRIVYTGRCKHCFNLTSTPLFTASIIVSIICSSSIKYGVIMYTESGLRARAYGVWVWRLCRCGAFPLCSNYLQSACQSSTSLIIMKMRSSPESLLILSRGLKRLQNILAAQKLHCSPIQKWNTIQWETGSKRAIESHATLNDAFLHKNSTVLQYKNEILFNGWLCI